MRVVELFCGAGGMSLGLKNAGFDLVQAYDNWKPAVETYRHNLSAHIWQHDLKDILGVGAMLSKLSPDIICGGPPCQDYSVAGQRDEGENARLTTAFAMLVCIARPQWFLMENVGQATKSTAWAEAKIILQRAGYGLTKARLNASYYGVAQNRNRLFVIGRLGERDGFLTSSLIAARSEKQMTLRDLFGPECPPSIFLYPRYRMNKSVWMADEPAPTIIASSLRPIPDSHDVPADTVVPTLQQMGQIQGFPAHWKWLGNNRHECMRLIANAVPVPLAEVIGRVILARESGDSIPAIQGNFSNWLMKKGHTNQVARNIKSQLIRARRLLDGRTFQNIGHEILVLEALKEFEALDRKVKSHLRAALRLYAEFLETSEHQRVPKTISLAA